MSAENPAPKQDSTPRINNLFQRIRKGFDTRLAAGLLVFGLGSSPVLPSMHYDANKFDPQKTSQEATSPERARATATPTPTEQTPNSSPDITVGNFQARPLPTPTPEGGPTLTAQQQLLSERGIEITNKAPIMFIGSYEMFIRGKGVVPAVAYAIQHNGGRLRLIGDDPRGALINGKGEVVRVLTDRDEIDLATLDADVERLAVAGDGKVGISLGAQSLESSTPTSTPKYIATPTGTRRVETPVATATPRPTATDSEPVSTPLGEESPLEFIQSTTTTNMLDRSTATATPGSETADSIPPAQQTRNAETVADMLEKTGTRFVGPIELTVVNEDDKLPHEEMLPHYELTKDEGTITVSGETLERILLLNKRGEVVKEIPASGGSATLEISELAREITGFAVQTAGQGDQHAVAYNSQP